MEIKKQLGEGFYYGEDGNLYNKDDVMMVELEEKDETFEIISKKEKYWRGQLEESEINLFKSEAGVIINKSIIDIASEEVEKEAKKNAR